MGGTETGLEKPMSRRAVFVAVWGMFLAIFWAIILLFGGGCCNIYTRTYSSKRKPIVVTYHPYYCTSTVWGDCLCAPFRLVRESDSDPIWCTIATITWPLWVVDEASEVVLDTIFLPADATYYCCKGE